MIVHQRAIPINSTTATVLRSDIPVRTGVVVSSADSTHFVLNAGSSAVNEFYTGTFFDFIAGPSQGYTGLITAYVGATVTALVTPAMPIAPTSATTFQIQPNLPPSFSQMTFGNTPGVGGVFFSFTPGGSLAATPMRFFLPASTVFEMWQGSEAKYIEFLSVAATDTLFLSWS
jgi:hypothetical protein